MVWDEVEPQRESMAEVVSSFTKFLKDSENAIDAFPNELLSEPNILEIRDLLYKQNILAEELLQECKDYLEHLHMMLHWAKDGKYF